MGPGASKTAPGKALMRGLRRAVQTMSEDELRTNLTDIRNKLNIVLAVSATSHPITEEVGTGVLPLHAYDDYSNDFATFATGE